MQSSPLTLMKMRMNLVCTRRCREAWWFLWSFIVFYFDDILLIDNDVRLLSSVKIQLSTQFQLKDLEEAQYILGIKVLRYHKSRKLKLSQTTYFPKLLVKYVMQDSKKSCYISVMEFLLPKINFLRDLRRKHTYKQYLMHPQWVALCMQCFVLGRIFFLQQVW